MAPSSRPSWSRDLVPESPCKWDLEKYIALGCLVLNKYFVSEQELYSSDSTWNEIDLRVIDQTGQFAAQVGNLLFDLVISGWVRAFSSGSEKYWTTAVRVYILPHDFGRDVVNRERRELSTCLRRLLRTPIDCSRTAWNAKFDMLDASNMFDPWAQKEEYSLHYLFNNLRSPEPNIEKIKCTHTKRAMKELLNPSGAFPGFKSTLYPFQAKAAAFMLQRESQPEMLMDPTLELRLDVQGRQYYYNPRNGQFFLEKRFYEANRGGILAESMGLGKTVMCLALIVATKGHMPAFPPEHQLCVPNHGKMVSLKELCARSAVRHSIPWRAYYRRIEEESNMDLSSIKKTFDSIEPYYEIPVERPRLSRNVRSLLPIRKTTCGGTIIVVPPNLMKQWKTELQKHVEDGLLRVFVMENSNQILPPAIELAEFDVVLFTKYLFERESVDGQDKLGRRFANGAQTTCHCPYVGASRNRDCSCLTTDDVYISPLKELHWLRIIVDEGHSFSTRNTRAAAVMDKLITSERRWVVSGTPAKDLVAIDVDLSIGDSQLAANKRRKSNAAHSVELSSLDDIYEAAAAQRKYYSRNEDTAGAAKALGNLSTYFLKVRPWSNSREDAEGQVLWEDHVYRHEDWLSKTYTCFSKCMRQVLEGLLIKTRIKDVERDLKLPPLVRKTVRLEPSLLDRLNANLFIQVLRANAVTSERTDQDYLFHPKGVRARTELIKNLRHSTFAWTGFREDDVQKSIDVSAKYLENPEGSCLPRDREMLSESIQMARNALESEAWLSLSRTHEIGVFVNSWPHESGMYWSLDASTTPIMTGSRLLIAAQKYVDEHLYDVNLTAGFSTAGIGAMNRVAIEAIQESKRSSDAESGNSKLEKTGVPASCTTGEIDTRHTGRNGSSHPKASPKKRGLLSEKSQNSSSPAESASRASKKRKRVTVALDGGITGQALSASPNPKKEENISGRIIDVAHRLFSTVLNHPISTPEVTQSDANKVHAETTRPVKQARFADDIGGSSHTTATFMHSPKSILKMRLTDEKAVSSSINPATVCESAIVGTSSAKLSYILSKVIAHEADEKIIIFFDSNNHAWYISECLELLNIPHLIYVRGLKSEVQSAYIDNFNNNPQVRVLLMDLIFGAHGLNLNAASMVLFVNPVCRPEIEAQAVKRAHRIGQKRQVLVETLVLKGTVEEAMLERAESMTRGEHKQAKLLEDDEGIKSIIQNATILPLSEGESTGEFRMVPLQVPQQIFDRPDKGRGKKIEGIDRDEPVPKPKGRNGKNNSRPAKMEDAIMGTFDDRFDDGTISGTAQQRNDTNTSANITMKTRGSSVSSSVSATANQLRLDNTISSKEHGESLAINVVELAAGVGSKISSSLEDVDAPGYGSTGPGAQATPADSLRSREELKRPSIFGEG